MKVDMNKCIKCGLCARDCSVRAIELRDKAPYFDGKTCFDCGHCVAICPTNAVLREDDMSSEILEYKKEDFFIDPKNLLNFIKFRRSVRRYKDTQVEPEKILNIIEAGRYTATSGNSQTLRYIVIQERLNEIRELCLKSLHDLAVEHPNLLDGQGAARYKERFVKQYEEYLKDGTDRMFFKAPALIVVVGDERGGINVDVDGGLAASNMELVAEAQGLGSCYIGFFVRALKIEPKIKEAIGVEDFEKVVTAFIIGYPDVEYRRTVIRNKANIKFM